jgi:hypothetical protein
LGGFFCFPFRRADGLVRWRNDLLENVMRTFRKTTHPKSVMFAVSYDDGRTAYLVVEHHGQSSEDYMVGAIAREHQEQGTLPEGTITGIKRVR